ncbi:MAG: transcription termination/antitermination protein NusA, partial [Firmicutes bacterium]|nr:transcription termination/antitermination protein NusA [Bacillota bacterium]
MDNKLLMEALDLLEEEKQISKEKILEALEAALLSAYKKNYYQNAGKNKDKDKESSKDINNVNISIDRETGDISIIATMTVVEEVQDDKTEVSLAYAHQIDPRFEVGDTIDFQIPNDNFKRIAAHAAKNVLKQKIRENERSMIYADFVGRQGEIVTGIVQRKSNRTLFVDIGRTEGILPSKEQVPGENFNVHDRIKALIMDVKKASDDSKTNKRNDSGSQVFLSRSHPNFVRKLFEMEVPEIQDGTVEIKGIAREAGSRTKIAVYTEFENVDPIGSCVGTRGSRVQAVVDELSGEKIDIIAWSEVPEELIANVLSPAEVEEVFIDDEEEKKATAIVPDRQLSLAIGKEGQNVRLAARVSGWGIDIKSHSQYFGENDENEFGYDYGDGAKVEDEEVEPVEQEAEEHQEAPEEDENK